ncbi:GIY-YIG nuclease family protein [Candidatus Uhrbacteria bacterium]|nr:GIY-YIG nuclease family protein [Candidatus Uhrbacteria bacterium]
MHYIYIIKSLSKKDEHYTGLTDNLRVRIREHNHGKSVATKRYMPWELIFYVAFPSRSKAAQFEKYLKSGSGRAFAQKHLI